MRFISYYNSSLTDIHSRLFSKVIETFESNIKWLYNWSSFHLQLKDKIKEEIVRIYIATYPMNFSDMPQVTTTGDKTFCWSLPSLDLVFITKKYIHIFFFLFNFFKEACSWFYCSVYTKSTGGSRIRLVRLNVPNQHAHCSMDFPSTLSVGYCASFPKTP